MGGQRLPPRQFNSLAAGVASMGTANGVLPPASQHNKEVLAGQPWLGPCATFPSQSDTPDVLPYSTPFSFQACDHSGRLGARSASPYSCPCCSQPGSVHGRMGPRPGDACVRRGSLQTVHTWKSASANSSRASTPPPCPAPTRARGFLLPRPCRRRQAIVETRSYTAHQAAMPFEAERMHRQTQRDWSPRPVAICKAHR